MAIHSYKCIMHIIILTCFIITNIVNGKGDVESQRVTDILPGNDFQMPCEHNNQIEY